MKFFANLRLPKQYHARDYAMRVKSLTLILPAIFLCGCLGPKVVKMDGDTYFVQKRSWQVLMGPPEGAKAKVYKVANKFAEKKGMAVETVDFKMVNTSVGRPGSAALQFRCVPPK